MRVLAGNQLTLDFEPSVRQRFPTLRQCVHYTVLQDPRGIKAVAADCDLSESDLSRRLAPKKKGSPRACDVDLMAAIMRSTKNLLPIQWMLAEFVPDDRTRQAAALSTVETLLPQLMAAVATMKAGKK
jgi:hypothetical protein